MNYEQSMKHHDTAISHDQGNIQKSYMKHRSFFNARSFNVEKGYLIYIWAQHLRTSSLILDWIHKPIPESIDDTEHSQSSRFYVVMEVDKLHKEYQGTRSIRAD